MTLPAPRTPRIRSTLVRGFFMPGTGAPVHDGRGSPSGRPPASVHAGDRSRINPPAAPGKGRALSMKWSDIDWNNPAYSLGVAVLNPDRTPEGAARLAAWVARHPEASDVRSEPRTPDNPFPWQRLQRVRRGLAHARRHRYGGAEAWLAAYRRARQAIAF